MMTGAQKERQAVRVKNTGRYAKINPCDGCGRSTGVFNYFSEGERGGAMKKAYRGIYYFSGDGDTGREEAVAFAVAHNWPTDRIQNYVRGWAIQNGVSGNYAGPGETPRNYGEKS